MGETINRELFIPALVSDFKLESEERKEKLRDHLHVEVSVSFKKKVYRIGLYEQFLSHLIQKYTELGKNFCIHETQNQKIESRTVGVVAALRGTVGVDNREVDFKLEEEDAKYNQENDTFESGPNIYFPHEKLLRLKVFCGESDEMEETLSFFDSVLLDIVKEDNIERWVTCRNCRTQGEENRFPAVKEFRPDNRLVKCENGHGWPIQRLKSKTPQATSEQTSVSNSVAHGHSFLQAN